MLSELSLICYVRSKCDTIVNRCHLKVVVFVEQFLQPIESCVRSKDQVRLLYDHEGYFTFFLSYNASRFHEFLSQ